MLLGRSRIAHLELVLRIRMPKACGIEEGPKEFSNDPTDCDMQKHTLNMSLHSEKGGLIQGWVLHPGRQLTF